MQTKLQTTWEDLCWVFIFKEYFVGERQDGCIEYRQVWDDGESLARVKHKKQIPGKDRGQAVSRRYLESLWTQASSGDGGAVSPWPDNSAAVSKQWSKLQWFKPQWQPEHPQQLGGNGRSLGAQEVNAGKELPVLLICLPWQWAEKEWWTTRGSAGIGWISQHELSVVPDQVPSCVVRQRVWNWKDSPEWFGF